MCKRTLFTEMSIDVIGVGTCNEKSMLKQVRVHAGSIFNVTFKDVSVTPW